MKIDLKNQKASYRCFEALFTNSFTNGKLMEGECGNQLAIQCLGYKKEIEFEWPLIMERKLLMAQILFMCTFNNFFGGITGIESNHVKILLVVSSEAP
jgi:hypothetical protein